MTNPKPYVNEDTQDIGVGPISLDVTMAREIGWSEDEIEDAARAIEALSRGFSTRRSIRIGFMCEACFRRKPDVQHLPCLSCGATGSDWPPPRSASDSAGRVEVGRLGPAGSNLRARRMRSAFRIAGRHAIDERATTVALLDASTEYALPTTEVALGWRCVCVDCLVVRSNAEEFDLCPICACPATDAEMPGCKAHLV